jgi:hypothetical protein
MLYNHFQNIHKIKRYEHAIHYVYIEAVANWDTVDARAKFLLQCLDNSKNIRVVRRDPTGRKRFGVYTGPAEKNLYNDSIKTKLATKTLCWGSPFTTIVDKDHVNTEAKIKERFYKELGNFQMKTLEAANPGFSEEKTCLTGKYGNGARKDDLVLATGICLLNMIKTICQVGYETGNAI